MIALDPEFIGALAPPSKLTITPTVDGKPSVDIPFSILPRLQRLHVQGTADETEVVDEAEEDRDMDPEAKKQAREEREKRKMRGKGKSLKRSAFICLSCFHSQMLHNVGTCGNSGRTSLTPQWYV
jgi:U3 small nucleolar RNA-associated protein 7